MINKKKIALLIFAFFFIVYVIFSSFLGNTKLYKLKKLIPSDQKKIIKKYFFPFKYIDEIENKNLSLEDSLEYYQKQLNASKNIIREKDKFISTIPEKIGFGEFNKMDLSKYSLKNIDVSLKEYKNYFLEIKKASLAKSGSNYLEQHEDKVIVISGSGNFSYFEKNSLNKDNFKTNIIDTNIKDFILYDDFYINSKFGIKDVFISKDKIYFSYIKEVEKDCFNTSVARAELNFDKLIFDDFFTSSECINSNLKSFQPHSSGGRLFSFGNNLLFSVGEYLDRNRAQDKNSIFGKILILDPLKINNYKVLSLGHRNPQGLYFDEVNEAVISTEHGPKGGDEININFDLDTVSNYGWPISSYGEHYSPSIEAYEKFPFYKSHIKHGFKEPIKYFVPSIGISQIVKLNNLMNFENNENFLIVGSLGNDPSEGDMSLHFITTTQDYSKIIGLEKINVKNRVRDIIILDNNKILCSFETKSTIGLITINSKI